MSPLAWQFLAFVFGPPFLLGILLPTVRWRVGYAVLLGSLFLLIGIYFRFQKSVTYDALAVFITAELMANVVFGGLAGTGVREMLERLGRRGNWKRNGALITGGALISFGTNYFAWHVFARAIAHSISPLP